ncbi:MAG: helix-turn-helix domain-containing protein [Clostridia bacterium]|nr:helix-turn-helix domain-containing protein [Clostridia bacterium]
MIDLLKIKDKLKRRFFKNLLLSYLVVMCLFVISTMITYSIFEKFSVDKEIKLIDSRITYAKTIIDSNVSSIQEKTYNFLGNDKLLRSNTYKKSSDIINELSKMNGGIRIADRCYLYTKGQTKIISSNGTENDNVLQKYNAYGIGPLSNDVLDDINEFRCFPVQSVYDGAMVNSLVFVSGQSYTANNNNKIISVIRESEIKNLYMEICRDGNFELLLINSTGHILSGNLDENVNKELNPKIMQRITGDEGNFFCDGELISFNKSDVLDGYYVLKMDRDLVVRNSKIIRNVNLLIFLAFLIISALLAIHCLNKYYVPVSNLLNKIENSKFDIDSSDEFVSIGRAFDLTIAEKEKYEEKLSLINLIEHRDVDVKLDEILNQEKAIGIVFKSVRVQESQKCILDYIKELDESDILFRIVSSNSSQIIAVANAADTDELRKQLDAMSEYVKKNTFYRLMIGVGDWIYDPSELIRSIEKAIYALDYGTTANGENIFFYNSSKPLNYVISLDSKILERKLRSLIIANDVSGINDVISGIFKENDEIPNIYKWYLSLAFLDIHSSIERKLQINSIENSLVIKDLQNEYSLETLKNFFVNIFTFSAGVYNNQSQKDNTIFADKMLNCIEANYHNPDFSIADLAESLNYSPSYTSSLFKSRFGDNFTQFLLNYRMEKARDLLDNTNLKINDVSTRVGFATYNNFARMFRKKYGISPGDYKSKKQ